MKLMWIQFSDGKSTGLSTIPSPPGPLGYLLFFSVACGSWFLIATLRLVEPGSDDRTMTIHGIYDETGHVLTAIMVAMGLRALRLPIPVWSVIIGGVILDLGHILIQLDFTEPVTGSSRNGTHSIAVVVLIGMIGFIDRRHANVWLGITIGALSHLWRDMGTGLVPLAWPLSDDIWGTSFTRYMVGSIGITVAMIGSGALLATYEAATRDADTDLSPR